MVLWAQKLNYIKFCILNLKYQHNLFVYVHKHSVARCTYVIGVYIGTNLHLEY